MDIGTAIVTVGAMYILCPLLSAFALFGLGVGIVVLTGRQ